MTYRGYFIFAMAAAMAASLLCGNMCRPEGRADANADANADADADDADADDDDDDDDDDEDDTNTYTYIKAQEFLLKIHEENPEKISEMRDFYLKNEYACADWLNIFGLGGFVKKEDSIKIPTKLSSNKKYVITGNPAYSWTICGDKKISFYEGEGVWICTFMISLEHCARFHYIESLRTALPPEDHFRVYAFIQLLNNIKKDIELLNE